MLTPSDSCQRMRARQHSLSLYCRCACTLVHVHCVYVACAYVCAYVRRFLLETCGVDAGDWVELGDAALGRRVKALRLSAHLEEHFLFLQLPGKLFLQGLQDAHGNMLVSYDHLSKY